MSLLACVVAVLTAAVLVDSQQTPPLVANPTSGGKSGNPGASLHLTRNLLSKNVADACREVEKRPPQDRALAEDIIIPLPKGTLTIGRVPTTSFSVPLYLESLVPPSQISWCLDRGRISATTSWNFVQTNDTRPAANYSGQLSINSLFTARVNTTLGRSDDAKPTITEITCQVLLQNSRFYFTTASPQARAIISEYEANATEILQKSIEDSLCNLLRVIVQMSLNRFLSTFRTKISLWNSPQIMLDYSLIADPYIDVDKQCICGSLKGAITVNGATTIPFYPHDFAASAIEDSMKMVKFLFSDYMLNSFLYSAYQSGMLKFVVNSDYSSKLAEILALDCASNKMCVGTAFPNVGVYPENSYAEVSLTATQPPTVIFMDACAHLQANGYGSLDIRVPGTSAKYNMYASSFVMLAKLVPAIFSDSTYDKINMTAEVIDLRLSTPVPDRSPVTRDMVVSGLSTILTDLINSVLGRGVPIPMFMNRRTIQIRDSELSLLNRTLFVNSNLVSKMISL